MMRYETVIVVLFCFFFLDYLLRTIQLRSNHHRSVNRFCTINNLQSKRNQIINTYISTVITGYGTRERNNE